ncbi:uncharacterized protein SCHCODRAFT_02732417 [Schizophyllum commune H4-8]|uniref:uncharacterized protein n=1 Tax=Schizophyllum commune (strain H4-8 / FGSC 9210) TaxID=578458 RepID=UPI00215F3909|nr:uncharacterized protein SCHCODRAFT_02732417 [Schizophyllum commune H4-8]KAI5892133.1 hypothetical protein SCHCODRAFT_02732417 [Schizophyllum commune H4-8]
MRGGAPSPAPPRQPAYTQHAHSTHSSLFPIFRRFQFPRTEVPGDQVPHQTDGSLMYGLEGRAAVVILGRLLSPWRAECISR